MGDSRVFSEQLSGIDENRNHRRDICHASARNSFSAIHAKTKTYLHYTALEDHNEVRLMILLFIVDFLRTGVF